MKPSRPPYEEGKLDSENLIPIGLCRETSSDSNYKLLLQAFNIGDLFRADIAENLERYINPDSEAQTIRLDEHERFDMPAHYDKNTVATIVRLKISEGMPIKRIAADMNIDYPFALHVFTQWKSMYRRAKKLVIKSSKGRKPIIRPLHISSVQEFLKHKRF